MVKLLLICQVFFVILLSAEPANNWLTWRGKDRDGISKESQWNISFSEKTTILWQKQIGKGHSSVVIQDNCLYTMGNIQNKDIIYCLNAETGEEIWRYEYVCEAGSFPGPRATPTLDGDGNIFTFSRNGQIFCLSAKDGSEKWKKNLIEEYGVVNLMHGISGSPCVIGDVVILNAGAAGFAFNKKTGEKLWGSDPKIECGYASPVPFQQNDVLIFSGNGLYLLETLTGKQKFFFPWHTEYALNAADPVVIGNKIFISSYNDKGTNLIEIKNDQPVTLWQNSEIMNAYTTHIALNGYLYGFSGCADMQSKLHCLDLETGKEKWSVDFKYGSLLGIDNKFIILDELGKLFVIKSNPEAYEELSQYTVFKTVRGMRAWTLPVFCNGKLYCRNCLGDIVCIQFQKMR